MFGFLFGSTNNTKSELMESDVAGFVVLDKSNEELKNNLKKNSENTLEIEPKWSRDEHGRLVRLKID